MEKGEIRERVRWIDRRREDRGREEESPLLDGHWAAGVGGTESRSRAMVVS